MLGACNAVCYGFPSASVLQHPAVRMLSRPVLHIAFGNSRVWQSQRNVGSFPASRSHKGIGSVRSQAQDDAVAAPSSTPTSYKTLAGPCTFTLEVKKSKFIAVASPVDDEAAALSFLSQVRDTSASHNCWAFKVGKLQLILLNCHTIGVSPLVSATAWFGENFQRFTTTSNTAYLVILSQYCLSLASEVSGLSPSHLILIRT
ncbi:hypothetical protein M758_11G050400 [Ceratodon purpureus]|nr:hypothetical protein M758_11G050400 [Ceratodon purpureus]